MKSVLLLLILAIGVQAANVLFYINTIGKSHLDFCDSLIDSLVDRGHTVDLIIARINDKVIGNGKSKAERVYSFGFKNGSRWGNTSHLTGPFDDRKFSFNGLREYFIIGNELCEIALSENNMFKFISERKYDIGIGSEFDYCGIGIMSTVGIPSIATFNALPILPIQAVTIGIPNAASQVIPLFYSFDLSTLAGRFWNLLTWSYINMIQTPQLQQEQTELFRKRFGNSFDIEEVIKKVDLTFINSNEMMEKPRPIHHKVQYIGGINLRTPKPVDEQFDRILSLKPNGTIIFSFGTQIPGKIYPRYAVKNFVKVFRKFPQYTFLWKYEVQNEEKQMFEEAENVIPVDWLPQTDLLYDPRVVGFITHVGLNSFNEASYAGKPMVAIPLFADQPHNAQNGVSRGTTIILNKAKLTEKSIESGLKAILFDESYTKNARKLQKMLIEKPAQPKERFVQWVEYAAENPGLHKVFELPGARMSIFQYYCVDAVLVLIFVPLFAIFVTFGLLKFIFSKVHLTRKIKTA